MNTRNHITYSIYALSIGLALLLTACTAAAPADEGQLAAIDFAHVEVGQGSPTPVTLTIDVSYPSTCAQFSEINQTFVEDGGVTRILIEVRTTNTVGVCNQDSLSFRMVLPINAVGLPKGVYEVEVNGVDAGSFEFQN